MVCGIQWSSESYVRLMVCGIQWSSEIYIRLMVCGIQWSSESYFRLMVCGIQWGSEIMFVWWCVAFSGALKVTFVWWCVEFSEVLKVTSSDGVWSSVKLLYIWQSAQHWILGKWLLLAVQAGCLRLCSSSVLQKDKTWSSWTFTSKQIFIDHVVNSL